MDSGHRETGFQLGPWTVRPAIHALERDGDVVRLEPKVMALLTCLAEHDGAVVTKEALLTTVWEDCFVSDEVLTTAVYALRRALGDHARQPRYIETIRTRGYRLVAPVQILERPTPTAASAAVTPAVAMAASPTASKESHPRAGRWWVAAVLAATALGGVLLGAMTQRQPDSTVVEVSGVGVPGANAPVSDATVIANDDASATPREIRSLAVLPLEALTEECRQDFFADTLTDMLIADLVDLGRMDVLPGLSTRVFGRRPDLTDLTSLAADAVVEGSVVRSGDRLWVSVQLVDTVTGQMLWGGSYEREGSDAMTLQRDLALEIARRINAATAPPIVADPLP